MEKIRFLVIPLILTVSIAACSPVKSTFLQVNDAWARPGLSEGNSAVYFVIDNPGAEDALLWASSDVAQAVEVHRNMMEGETMQMMPQKDVPVPGGATAFEPGGLHIMLINLKDDLNPGDTFDVTLMFKTAGERTVTVPVKEP
jgi:hypothetical protein